LILGFNHGVHLSHNPPFIAGGFQVGKLLDHGTRIDARDRMGALARLLIGGAIQEVEEHICAQPPPMGQMAAERWEVIPSQKFLGGVPHEH
jgi:hypothetical protein